MEKINSFRDLQDILSVELWNSNIEYQAQVTNFVVENMCENGIITRKAQIWNIATILKAKFNNSQAMIIMDKLKAKVAKTNTVCLNYLKHTILGFMESKMSESIRDNSKNRGDDVSTKKNINIPPEDHKDDEAKNDFSKGVFEQIKFQKKGKNRTRPAPQIKIYNNIDKDYW